MKASIANLRSTGSRTILLRSALRIIFWLMLLLGLGACDAWDPQGPASAPPTDARFMSAEAFEEQHGLQVYLIGVTAGGGMIDFRLKMINSEKARAFLEDPANMPRLIAADSGKALTGVAGLDDNISYEEGGILFLFFSNTGSLIQPGTPVIVRFADVRLEPILAQ